MERASRRGKSDKKKIVKHKKKESSAEKTNPADKIVWKHFKKCYISNIKQEKVQKNHVLSIVCKTSRNFGQIRN